MLLLQPPDAAVREVVSKYGVLCEYLERVVLLEIPSWQEHNGKMPTTVQLQHCAKNSGLGPGCRLEAATAKVSQCPTRLLFR